MLIGFDRRPLSGRCPYCSSFTLHPWDQVPDWQKKRAAALIQPLQSAAAAGKGCYVQITVVGTLSASVMAALKLKLCELACINAKS